MNLYELISDLIAAVRENTAAIQGKAATGEKSAAATTEKASTGTKATGTKATKPKGPSKEEMVAKVTEVKEKLGAAEAKAIIKEIGGVDKMGEIAADKYAAVFQAAADKLAEADNAGGDDEDDGL